MNKTHNTLQQLLCDIEINLDFSAELTKGSNVLITGSSGCGKTSIFRVLRGLWGISSGSIECHWICSPGHIFFIPQKPYFPDGGCTLRQQIVFPKKFPLKPKGRPHSVIGVDVENECDNEGDKVAEVLGVVELEELINRCGGLDQPIDREWRDILSPGELQRLSLARAFYHRPRLVFLDEATSAIGFDLETKLYETLIKMSITCVSIGHRLSLKKFHKFELHLDGKGGWTWLETPFSSRSESLVTTSSLGL